MKNRKLSKEDAKKMLPLMQEFNSIAKGFARILTHNTKKREERIRILINELAVPESSHNLSIQSVEFGNIWKKRKKKKKFESDEAAKLKEQYLKDLKNRIII